jgi:hypothetical protein
MSWRQAMRARGARWARGAGRKARQARQVAARGYERAWLAGRRLAVRVIAVQKAARLDPKLMRRSLESVRRREHARDADRAFRDGYVQQSTSRRHARQSEPDAHAEPAVSADFLRRQQAQALADSEATGDGVLLTSDHDSEYFTPAPGPGGHDRGGMPPGAIPAGSLRPLRFEPSARAGTDRLPPGHGRLVGRGHFASPQEARAAADAWRNGASFGEYLDMGTGRTSRGPEPESREAGQ